MKRKFDEILEAIKEHILEMGVLVESAVEKATQGLLARDLELIAEVYKLESKINAQEIAIDENCLLALARNAPVAGNLRLVVAIIKINNDLERMGDLATNIAHNAEEYLQGPELKPLVDIPLMAQKVRSMIGDVLQSLVQVDIKLAQEILQRDAEINQLRDAILDELLEVIEKNPATARKAMQLIAIAKNLERLGDHATNIAEKVIYISTGTDVRHGQYK